MKTLHINTERTWRGGERQTLFLLEGLRSHDIEAHLVCQPGSPLAKRALQSGITTWPLAMRGEGDFPAGFALRRLAKRYDYDLIHSHTSHAHTLSFWATAGRRPVRLVTRRVEYSIYRNSFFGLNRIKYRHMADAYIAISERIEQVLISDGVAGQMIHVVPSGVIPEPDAAGGDGPRTEFGIGENEPILLSIAHLTPEKGHDILLQAMAIVADHLPAIRLVVVGDGQCRADLEALAERLGIERQVIFTGFRDDVGAFYDMAAGFVSSSTAEGLGSAVLDALAAGVPVVAAAAGGIPEIIENGRTGILVPPASPEALARGIVDLFEQPRLADEMAARGRQLVRSRFSVDAMVDGTLAVYRRLLQP